MNLFKDNVNNISIQEIETKERFFEYSVHPDPTKLEESIKRVGVLNPIWIFEENKSFKVIAGFKRIDAAKKIGLTEIPTRILNDNREREQAFQHVLEEQKAHRPFNVIEVARILGIIKKLQHSTDKKDAASLSLIGIPDNNKIIDKYLSLLELTKKVQEYIAVRDMSLKQTEIFRGLDREEQEIMIRLAESLKINSHELGEICVNLFEISKRENKTIQSVWEELASELLPGNEPKNRNKNREIIRQRLKEKRFPVLIKKQKELEDELTKLTIKSKGKWTWDPTFERPGLVYHPELLSPKDCDKISNDFSNEKNRKILEKILKMI